LYYGLESVCLPLTFDQQHEISLDFYYVQTKFFYSTYSPRKLDLWTPKTDKILGYNVPYVNISVVNDSIYKIQPVIKEITKGYLEFLQDRSLKLFKKDIENLNEQEKELLLDGYNFSNTISYSVHHSQISLPDITLEILLSIKK